MASSLPGRRSRKRLRRFALVTRFGMPAQRGLLRLRRPGSRSRGNRGYPQTLCASAPLRETSNVRQALKRAPKNPPTTLQKTAAPSARFEMVRRSSPTAPAQRAANRSVTPARPMLFENSTLTSPSGGDDRGSLHRQNANRKSSVPNSTADALLKSANKNQAPHMADLADMAD